MNYGIYKETVLTGDYIWDSWKCPNLCGVLTYIFSTHLYLAGFLQERIIYALLVPLENNSIVGDYLTFLCILHIIYHSRIAIMIMTDSPV